MKIRFQADADLNQIILQATVRRESSIDFQTAEAAGLAHLQDRDVLVMAAREGRILVTHDQKPCPGTSLNHYDGDEPGFVGGSPAPDSCRCDRRSAVDMVYDRGRRMD